MVLSLLIKGRIAFEMKPSQSDGGWAKARQACRLANPTEMFYASNLTGSFADISKQGEASYKGSYSST